MAVAAGRGMKRLAIVMAVVCLHVAPLGAQSLDLSDPAISAVAPRDQEVTLTYENRPILLLRARVMNRLPADRAANASRLIKELVSAGTTGPVETRAQYGAQIISVAQQDIIAVTPADLYVLNGETLEATAELAAARLRNALEEAKELRSVRALVRGTLAVFAVTAILVALLWLVRRLGKAARLRFLLAAERRTTATCGWYTSPTCRASPHSWSECPTPSSPVLCCISGWRSCCASFHTPVPGENPCGR